MELNGPRKLFSTTSRILEKDQGNAFPVPRSSTDTTSDGQPISRPSPEDAALNARKIYGDSLPDGHLNEEELKVYQRLYGTPAVYQDQTEFLQDILDEEAALETGTGVLREGEDGALEEVEFDIDEEIDEEDGGVELLEDELEVEGPEVRVLDDAGASTFDLNEPRILPTEEDEFYQRTHPLTLATRFTTAPSTLPLPTPSLIDPIEHQIAHLSNAHLQQAAHRTFGGIGLPYSTSTPNLAKTMQAKPIPLDAGQNHMSEMEGNLFLSALFPGIYATVVSVLVETRKRLGSKWTEELVEKAQRGDLRILDAGGGGAGILAVREMLRAEWERMIDDDPFTGSSVALAEADGRIGAANASPPLGQATVLTGSDMLRRAASQLLENTAFIPRLPDYLHTQEVKKEGKFDLVIAPHTLWGLREDWARRAHTMNLWSLLKQDGGTLVMLEKGVARGFECVADARQLLLASCIGSSDPNVSKDDGEGKNEGGMIIAPCTNHSSCPMYPAGLQGMVKGRRDICHFSQRYVRPPFLQKILGARDKNFEDVKFSYLSVMRGRDLRDQKSPAEILEQNETTTQRAFEGYEATDSTTLSPSAKTTLELSLPRSVLTPLKRRGHVILDVCTPSGTLERWTVPKSFSKQAFRDARKSSWGDLWPLGAKTRVLRTVKGRKKRDGDVGEETVRADMDVKVVSKKRSPPKGKGRKNVKRKGVKEARKKVDAV